VIEAGVKAPDFTLPDQDGNEVSLADYRGTNLVVCFYPADFSPVCSDQLAVYQEVKHELDTSDAELVGISVDSAWCHRAFRDSLGVEFTLLADFHPKGEVARAYGAYLEDHGMANRSLVLIDPEGVVRWAHASPTPLEIPGANLIFDALAA
jgi:peroxiredoxin